MTCLFGLPPLLISALEQVLTFFLILLFVPGLVDRFVGKIPLVCLLLDSSQFHFIQQKKLQLESTMDVAMQVCYFSKTPGN